MSLVKKIFRPDSTKAIFTPSDPGINWTHVETLVHGPGTPPWRSNRELDGNSAVFACLMAICTSTAEPPKVVYQRMPDGNEEPVEDGPLQQILDNMTPEGELSPEEIDFWTAWALHTDGNAYWMKIRSGNAETGNVVQLWPVSPTKIEPITEVDRENRPKAFISHYKLLVAPNEYVKVPIQNIIHFRNGIRDRDMRYGVSPLKKLLREISTDEEASRFTEALLRNFAVPGLVVVPTEGTGVIDKPRAQAIQETFDRKFSSEQRGTTVVLSREATVEQFGFSPEQMDLGLLHRIPEQRIAAVLGIPAIVAGLGAGLERSTYSNFREAREMYTESKLVPYWRGSDVKLNTSLTPDFYGKNSAYYIAHDLTNVRALQEDETAKYERLDKGVKGKWILRNEARADVGLPPIDGWDEEDVAPPAPPAFGEETEETEEETEDEEPAFGRNGQNGSGKGGAHRHDAPFPAFDWQATDYP